MADFFMFVWMFYGYLRILMLSYANHITSHIYIYMYIYIYYPSLSLSLSALAIALFLSLSRWLNYRHQILLIHQPEHIWNVCDHVRMIPRSFDDHRSVVVYHQRALEKNPFIDCLPIPVELSIDRDFPFSFGKFISPLVCLDRSMGEHGDTQTHTHMYIYIYT